MLGYIPLAAFFKAARQALTQGGQLAFIVHRENSPREALEIFAELVAEEPTALRKRVAFDFPRDTKSRPHAPDTPPGWRFRALWQDSIVFRYDSAEKVLEHLLKSGAGTAFYDAIDPARRDVLTARFLHRLTQRQGQRTNFDVCHEYVACVAGKP